MLPEISFTAYYQNPEINPEVINYYRDEFGLDKPFYIQFFMWLKKGILSTMTLGCRFPTGSRYLILSTQEYGTQYFLISSACCSRLFSHTLLLSTFPTSRTGSLKKVLILYTLILYSVPGFLPRPSGTHCSGERQGCSRLEGATSEGYETLSFMGKFYDRFHHIILPIIVGFIGSLAGSIRSMKVLLSEEFHKPYITAVRAKGAGKAGIIKHAFRNALIPLYHRDIRSSCWTHRGVPVCRNYLCLSRYRKADV